jgi:hypothetical protein
MESSGRKVFKTKVLMTYSTVPRVDGGDSFVYSDKCNSGDYFAVTNYSDSTNWNKWKDFFAKLPQGKKFIFEVKLSGAIETSLTPQFGHLSWSRAEIKITEIESIKDVTAFAKKPDHKAETPLINFGKGLWTIGTEVVLFLLGSKNTINIDEFIAPDFVLTDALGKKFNRETILNLKNQYLFNEIENYQTIKVSNEQSKQTQNSYKVYGFVVISDKEGKEKRLNFENTFQYKNDSWSLIEIRLSNP